MLRVGLTGELGSGKSTVARMLAARGAIVLSSDEMGRAMMQPGESVYAQILERFGPAILRADSSIDRAALGRIAFDPAAPRVEELNTIIHPAVIAEQAKLLAEIAREHPHAIAVIESALIFSTRHSSGWRDRFDCIVLVTASDEVKLQRFVERASARRDLSQGELADLRADARQRLLAQRVPIPPGLSFIPIENDGAMDDLETKAEALWQELISIEQRTQNSQLRTLNSTELDS